ncbi:hypothetical protein GQ457_08G036490 [Hibiscus cannabinus]
MVAIDETESEELELRIETKRTTKNMQIETGVRILMISSPKESRRDLGLWFWAIWVVKIGIKVESWWSFLYDFSILQDILIWDFVNKAC